MRISDWSSDVCSSDLSDLDIIALEVQARLFSLDEEASRHRLTATGSSSPADPSISECQSLGCLDKWRSFDRCPFSRTFTRRCTTKCTLCLRSSPSAARSALSLATSSGPSTKAHVRLSREPRSSIPSTVTLDRPTTSQKQHTSELQSLM